MQPTTMLSWMVVVTMFALVSAFEYDDATMCPLSDDPNDNIQHNHQEELPEWAFWLVSCVSTFGDSNRTILVPLYSIAVTLYLL